MSRNLIKSLINAAEKAANIARKCREDDDLLTLLTQEKNKSEANPRFVQDFKTLADVLIQECIIKDVGNVFPELRCNIRGEESSNFTNTLGESVCVKIGDTIEETSSCLAKVLNNKQSAADVLAYQVHKEVEYSTNFINVPELPSDLNYENIGIWIDPIDGTSQYIAGQTLFSDFPGITSSGLDCVTVLIGAFDTITGIPLLGVINQPFHTKINSKSYKSQLFWGVALNELHENNINKSKDMNENKKIALFSSSEDPAVLETFKNLKYEIAFSAGAGHKALKVITSEADFYLLSKGSTFKWDTCGPQAILMSLGGGLFDFTKSIASKILIPISYSKVEDSKCNFGGVIALKDIQLAETILEALS